MTQDSLWPATQYCGPQNRIPRRLAAEGRVDTPVQALPASGADKVLHPAGAEVGAVGLPGSDDAALAVE
jgi:hypothetical protein